MLPPPPSDVASNSNHANQLLYKIQLFSLSSGLPLINKRTHEVFKDAPISFRADFTLARYFDLMSKSRNSRMMTRKAHDLRSFLYFVLSSRLCSSELIDFLIANRDKHAQPFFRLSSDCRKTFLKRLFSRLSPKRTDAELLILRNVLRRKFIEPQDLHDLSGFPLERAVLARFEPLIGLLLKLGISPWSDDARALEITVRRGDVAMFRMLVIGDRSSVDTYARDENGMLIRLADKGGAIVADSLLRNAALAHKQHLPMIELLVNHGSLRWRKEAEALRNAVVNKRLDTVQRLLGTIDLKGKSPKMRDNSNP